MLKKGWTVLSAFPRILHARMRSGNDCPSIGLAVSDAWPDRYQFRRLPYDLALARAGARVVTMAPSRAKHLDRIIANIHGLVLAGGEDIHPDHSGADEGDARSISLERDKFEMMLLDRAARRNIPVLCICRGAQLLAVWAGGRIECRHRDAAHAKGHISTPGRLAWHKVVAHPGSRLHDIFGGKPVFANSFHRYVITDAGRLRVSAVVGENDVEGVELAGERFVVGVQWHPELQAVFSEPNQKLFRALVHASVHEPSNNRSNKV